MKKASITEAKNGLSAVIDWVKAKAGAAVPIVDRGPLALLVRDGLVRPPVVACREPSSPRRRRR